MTRPPLQFTLIQADEPARLTKAFSIGPAGQIVTEPAGELVRGTVHAAQAADLRDLFNQLQALPPAWAATWGTASAAGVPVVARRLALKPPGAITRTGEHFKFRHGPGVMMIDHDGPAPGDTPLTAPQLVGLLIKACPALADAPLLARPSASAGVCVAGTANHNPQAGRWRLYLPVLDASKIPEAGERLGRLLQADNHAWAIVGKSGQIMQRTLVDLAVWRPERLDFAAPPVCGPGVQRTPPQALIFNESAGWFDLNRIATTKDTDAAAAALVMIARAKVHADAVARRAEWVEENAPRIAARTGRTVDDVRHAYETAIEGGELMPWFELRLQGGEVVTVAEVVRRWPEHAELRLCDPMEPDRDDGDDRIAFFYERAGVPWIYSHDDGGIRYCLPVDESERVGRVFRDALPPMEQMPLRQPQALPAPPLPATAMRLVRADTIAIEPVRWVWPGYLPAGMLAILGGAPGCGKTTIALALAAAVTTGSAWPDGTPGAAPADVLVWSGEDLPSVLAGRLAAMGADRTRVHFVDGVGEGEQKRAFDPGRDMPLLEVAASELPAPRLLIVDPIVSAVAGDSHKNAEVRRSLQPVVDLAQRLGCAVLGITHFTKGTAGRDPTERITGSLAFAALARVVLVAAKVKAEGDGDAERRVFLRAKSNIGPDTGGMAYELERTELQPGIEGQRVRWLEPIEGGAREVLAEAEGEGQQESPPVRSPEMVRFIHQQLAGGSVDTKEFQAAAEAQGYSWNTVTRRAKKMGAIADKKPGEFQGGWVWKISDPLLWTRSLPRAPTPQTSQSS